MINLILGYLIIQIISIFYSIKFKKNIGNMFILTILSIIVILYLFGLFNLLSAGVYLIEIVSIGILIYECIYFYKNKNKVLPTILNKENIIFTLMFIGLSVIHSGRMISTWDEFSHWGDVVKAMFTINDFSTSSKSMSQFQSYPPAMSLFQYFFMKIGNNYIESNLYIAYQLFFVSLIMPFISKSKKVFDSIIILIAMLLVPIIVNSSFYTTIYIDSILGLLFGYLLSTIMLNSYDKHQVLTISLSLFTLVLLKDVGMFLAIIALMMIIVDLIFVKKKITFKNNFFSKNKKYIVIIVTGIVAVLLAKLSWNLDIKINDAYVSFGNKITVKEILNFLTFNNLGYRGVVISNFLKNLYTKNIVTSVVNLNTITMSLITAIILILVLSKQKNNSYYTGCIFGGLIIYIIGLAFIYCFKFSEYEAIRLASYSRYIAIYLSAILFVIIALVTYHYKPSLVLLLVMLLFIPYGSLYTLISSINESKTIREPYESAVKELSNIIDGNDKVYIISQNTTGFDYWVLKYSLRPNEINKPNTWSIGEKYGTEDIWTAEYTKEEWMELLIKDNYDYVYIYKCDDQFIKQYSELFIDDKNINSQKLFKVVKDTKQLELVK